MNLITIKLTCPTNPDYYGSSVSVEQADLYAHRILEVAEAFFHREFENAIISTRLVPNLNSVDFQPDAFEKVNALDKITRDDIIEDFKLMRDRMSYDTQLLEGDFNVQTYLADNFPA